MKLTRVLVALALFGVAFAYIEAAVVVYLREILGPVHEELFAGVPHDEVFPLWTPDQLEAAGPKYTRAVMTEVGRELATLLVLGGVGLAVARNFRQWLAALMIAFGVWDVFYYVFLRLLLGWPASIWTWDCLFMLPVIWAGPVIAPVLVSVSMIVAGVGILWRESGGRPVHFAWFHWMLISGGALIIIVAFCWDWRNTSTGGWPSPFNWPLFILGEVTGAAGFVHAFFAGGGLPGGNRGDG